MGLFRRFGREVEQFKQTATEAAEEEAAPEDADYQCRACDARLNAGHDECPECGAEEVTPTDTEE